MKIRNESILKIDFALIVFSLAVLIVLVGYARPLVIAPLDDYETTESEILFSIRNADTLLIDDNEEFTSPDEYEIREGLQIELEPGKYYWKAVGVLGSEIRTLTVKSRVSFELVKVDGAYGVVNSGNTRLDVDVYNGTELVEKIKLAIGGTGIGEGDKFVGGMA